MGKRVFRTMAEVDRAYFPNLPGWDCPDCTGGISHKDSRDNIDHMNAHLCRTCSGTGKVTPKRSTER